MVRVVKSTGRRGGLTEARARIRTITTPVPQLRLRQTRARQALMKRSNHLNRSVTYPVCSEAIQFYLRGADTLLRFTRGSTRRRRDASERDRACPVFADPNRSSGTSSWIICNARSLTVRWFANRKEHWNVETLLFIFFFFEISKGTVIRCTSKMESVKRDNCKINL